MMSKLNNIKVLHLEPTDACNLACSLCARETDLIFDKSNLHHLTVDQIKKSFSEDFTRQLDKMFMCGNYGDPAAGKHTLDIYRYFRKINPKIELGMNTNGSLRSTNWWKELADVFILGRNYVVFSIDGLEDTNHIYRVNSNWDKLIANVQSFISAGGVAHWDMLIYKHNEHQVDAAQQLAKDLGFKWFRAKVSKRPLVNSLEYPIHWVAPTRPVIGKIKCHALSEQSVYIDAQGRVSPCCWLGCRQGDFITDISQVAATWSSNSPHPVCAEACFTLDSETNFERQWRYEVAF
jgi:sulfatase maturation enzyme AslB (radical SAM superfamily)